MREAENECGEFGWASPDPTCAHGYVFPFVESFLQRLPKKPGSLLDIGCGNGAVTARLAELGISVTGVDVSEDGVRVAQAAHPSITFHLASVYSPEFRDTVGRGYDCVVSLEVIEHLFSPAALLDCASQVLKPNGYLIVSTPYHGYLKNMALSIFNAWDRHFTVDHDGGHIKFFSRSTLRRLLKHSGFTCLRMVGAGRVPYLWKSLVVLAQKV